MFDPFTLTTLGSVLLGTSLAIVSFTKFAVQREYLRGDNKNISVSVGILQGIMASVLMRTLSLAVPVLVTMPFISVLGWFVFLVPVAASLAAGGYEKIRNSWAIDQDSVINKIISTIDSVLAKVPAPIASLLTYVLSRLHKWLGTIIFVAQIATFAFMIPSMPIVGISGLVYLGSYYARGKNLLPAFIAKVMEKFNYWVDLFSGFFIGGTVLKVTAFLGLATEFIKNVAFPIFLKKVLGQDSDFLQLSELIEAKKPTINVPRNIAKQKFMQLLAIFPHLTNSKSSNNAINKKVSVNELLEQLADPNFQSFMRQEWSKAYQPIAKPYQDKVIDLLDRYPQLPQNSDFVARIKYYASFALYYPQLGLAIIKDLFFTFKATVTAPAVALDAMERKNGQGLAINIKHMAYAPNYIKEAPPINYVEFEKLVAGSGLDRSKHSFKANCLASPKFQRIDLNSHDRLVELNNEQSDLRMLGKVEDESYKANYQEIKKVNSKILEAWRIKLTLPDATSEDDICTSYVLTRFAEVCNKIYTGQDMLWDKKVDSFKEFQNMGFHLLAYCQDLLINHPEDYIVVHDIIARLAIEAGDFCANGVYDVVKDLFSRHVLSKIQIQRKDMNIQDELAIYLQDQRQNMFDALYAHFKEMPIASKYFPHVHFDDRHTYSQVTNLFGILNLKSKFNAKSDLSNNNLDVVSKFRDDVHAFLAARLIMVLDAGYSPKGIIERMITENGDDDSSFNFGVFCTKWAEEFDEDVKEFISDILVAYGTNDAENLAADLDRRRLCALMLYDLGILKTIEPILERQILALFIGNESKLQLQSNEASKRVAKDTSKHILSDYNRRGLATVTTTVTIGPENTNNLSRQSKISKHKL